LHDDAPRRMRRPSAPRGVSIRIVVLVLIAFLAGAEAGPLLDLPLSLGAQPPNTVFTFRVFWEAWNLVQQHYVERSRVDPQKMTYGAVQGMLDALGDIGHTRFLTPDELQEERQAISGQLEGIGAELVIREQGPTILAPLPGSPAQQAGIRAGDTIVRVNDQEVAGMSLDAVVHLIRGPAGSGVTLTVLHPGDTTLSAITVTRARFSVPAVTSAMIPGTSIAHVLLSQFSEHATDQLAAAITSARDQGATSMILDLRNDTGGLRDEAIGVASQFLSEGNVLIERDAQGHDAAAPVKPGGVAPDIPMVVLINEGTASSAEIVAGALQDYDRGLLIGATTVGTGTVLSSYELSDGSALLLGTRQWLTPKGHQIWHHGITPDIPVPLPPGATPLTPREETDMTPAAFQSSQDAQLMRAVQQLRSGNDSQ